MANRANSEESGRRAFLRGAGAVASAALVPATAAAAPGSQMERTQDDAAAIRTLYQEYAAGFGAQCAEPGAAVQLRLLRDPAQPPDTIRVAAGGQTARAQFHCMVQTATPLVGQSSLVEMARLQGQHGETWWEAGVHELDCVKVEGQWTIRQLAYRKGGVVTLR